MVLTSSIIAVIINTDVIINGLHVVFDTIEISSGQDSDEWVLGTSLYGGRMHVLITMRAEYVRYWLMLGVIGQCPNDAYNYSERDPTNYAVGGGYSYHAGIPVEAGEFVLDNMLLFADLTFGYYVCALFSRMPILKRLGLACKTSVFAIST